MKKTIILSGLILLIILILTGCARKNDAAATGQITEFSASDMPDDDGSGVILKWKPLDKKHRIIKYNIYRGTSPDSLFLLTFLEVDPKMGVLAPELFYYDLGDQPLIEFESSPMRLKKEKHQAENSPLYQKFPIDAELLGSVLPHYSVFGALKAENLHYKSKPIQQEEDILAGLKVHQFESIFAAPKEGNTYYYSVLGVNERGYNLPHAEVQSVIPVDNPPQASAILNATYVADQRLLNFEWNPPSGSSDIAAWEGWLIPKASVSEDQTLPEKWQQNALQLFQIPNMYNGQAYYHSVDLKELPVPQSLDGFVPVLSYFDYKEQRAAVKGKDFFTIASDKLPIIPKFSVHDKANDKGDNLVLSLGKPLAYITQADFTNHARKRLKINYDIAVNEQYDVERILFKFRTPDGQEIGSVKEHFVDKTIHLNLPDPKLRHLTAEIKIMVRGAKSYEPQVVTQQIVYNDYFKRFEAQDIFLDGVDIDKLFIDVFVKSKLDWDFAPDMRMGAITRSYEHSIPLEDLIFKSISGYDQKSKRLLLSSKLTLATDAENGMSLEVPIFKSAFEKELQTAAAEITDLKAQIAANPAAKDSLEDLLQEAEAQQKFTDAHPISKEIKNARNDRAWVKALLKLRNQASRSYAYKLLVTDGKGGFTFSEPYVDDKDNQWFTPIAEWFNKDMLITLFGSILLLLLLVYAIYVTRRKEVYIRPIAGLQEIDNAVGRATEMGRPVMFVPGWGTLGDVCTIASLMILSKVAKKTAEYDIRLISPQCDYMVLPLAQEIIQTSYSEVGRPDSYNQNDIFFISYDQFPFCAGVNGITVRERVATIFYMGFFNAEALLLTETGNQAGAIQIAATDAVTQIPFFITTCDYTLIGEEFYAASAYLSRNHELVSMLKAQDYFKLIIVIVVIIGTILSTLHINGFINAFPIE